MALPDMGARAWGVVVVTASSSWDEEGSDGTEPAAGEPGGRVLRFGERVCHLRPERPAPAGAGRSGRRWHTRSPKRSTRPPGSPAAGSVPSDPSSSQEDDAVTTTTPQARAPMSGKAIARSQF